MAIYTKRGDRGETSLYGSQNAQNIRVSKSSLSVAAIGAIDELNSYLGIVGGLESIQDDLFTINSTVAGSKLAFSKAKTKKLEREIDKLEGTLPVLKNFIFYGGSESAPHLFYARALCRRAERAVVKLVDIKPEILAYLNRLSDYLFMLARKVTFEAKAKEKIWRP